MTDDPRDAFFEGAGAFFEGKGWEENPYDPIQDEFLLWEDGWLAAEESEANE